MARLVNAARGEVALEIGGASVVLCVTMDGLARYSQAIAAPSLQECFLRVQQSEPAALLAFVRVCAIDGDSEALIRAMRPAGGLDDLMAMARAAQDAMAVFVDASAKKA